MKTMSTLIYNNQVLHLDHRFQTNATIDLILNLPFKPPKRNQASSQTTVMNQLSALKKNIYKKNRSTCQSDKIQNSPMKISQNKP